jgi:hypothetical protein
MVRCQRGTIYMDIFVECSQNTLRSSSLIAIRLTDPRSSLSKRKVHFKAFWLAGYGLHMKNLCPTPAPTAKEALQTLPLSQSYLCLPPSHYPSLSWCPTVLPLTAGRTTHWGRYRSALTPPPHLQHAEIPSAEQEFVACDSTRGERSKGHC